MTQHFLNLFTYYIPSAKILISEIFLLMNENIRARDGVEGFYLILIGLLTE
jgi:hypothetical protein